MSTQAKNTKEALVITAQQMFAERGYDGVSIAEIAGDLGITKQALLHHFGSKEKLYGRVLEDLSQRFSAIMAPHLSSELEPGEQFRAIMRDLYSGRVMARMMSIAMMIFTIFPAFAPIMGAGIIALIGWRGIFLAFILFSLICVTWMGVRLPEPLAPEDRRRLPAP